ncbi:MAG TPA: SRPBCC family protein [Stackebrandtia sp.]|jgi:uncharacterized protein YndB with AHSA1/START domain|uniref:SRPBCC family protein n=1 Tax=Stackebrandtia sp. TaxID=2023065 RepID=UPI002D38F39C|nr:SRPBCC family protein [Stackebrandtia sp.]HZE39534.1 SRPBCC family protein [Stackebrandtia sp.]
MSDGTGVVGTLHLMDGKGVVRMEDVFDTAIEDLWSALTEPKRLARWIGEVEGEPRLGERVRARFTSSWEGWLRVDVCEPPRRLEVASLDNDASTVIAAELFAEGDRTRLVVEERGFPVPEVAAHGAGWQAHIEDLGAYLADTPRRDWVTRWKELSPSYREQARDLA